jgi:ribosomal protein S18 acetylase RimI-like enzyme
MMKIEAATVVDAAEIATLARDTFSETFGHLYPPGDLAIFLNKYTPAFFINIIRNPVERIWIAREAVALVGYAHAGQCELPHSEVTPGCGELKRLYVRRGAQKGGVGGALLDEALTWLNAPGRKLWIGVWSENHGAQRLYGRHSFRKVGEYEFIVGKMRDREFILRRDNSNPYAAIVPE